MKHVGDATFLRKVNESAILELIREEGPVSRSEIARRLRLSPATITRIVNVLLENHIVLEGNPIHSQQGRRPVLLEFNPWASLIIGVYVHKNMVGALSDLNGKILERRVVPSLVGEAGVKRLIGLVEELHQASKSFGPPVRGVGIGAPSIVTFDKGAVVWAPSLGWRNLPLKARLEEALNLPVFVENEVNLIALGESWRGNGQGVRNLACISLGAGIGAGIVLDGQLYRGSHDAAGEVGYIIPNQSCLGRVYNGYGCLESLAGSMGIVQRALARLADGESSVLGGLESIDPLHLTVEMVLSAARQGDSLAQSVISETVDYLSIAIANLICILDPDRVVISGDLAEFGDLFVQPIRSRLEGALPQMPDIVLSELGTDAAVLGALAIALYKTEGGIFVHKAHA
ncbi:MAG: ROK family transcriptional regulator [Anaerolineales bacterium]|nr:MAG: ROK family transcriptional regulator [Anaerolineales bacterium]